MKVSYLAGMNVSASGLAAQRQVMNTVAENLANAQTTRTESGGPYRRKIVSLVEEPVSFEEKLSSEEPADLARTQPGHFSGAGESILTREASAAGVVAEVSEDPSDLPSVYDPGHPDADPEGMVRMPNVDTAREMVTLLAASRAYEANIAALQAARRLAESSLNLAR
jgi:flagellar basal-body rod protein FlgC